MNMVHCRPHKLLLLAFLAPTAIHAQAAVPRAPEIVVVPTLGSDHQFNLDYSVAHLAGLLEAIAADAVVIPDFTGWLRAGCIWSANSPEAHVAMGYVREHGGQIWGTRTLPSPRAYERQRESARQHNERYDVAGAVAREYRSALDQTTARIAREYTFADQPQTLRRLLDVEWPARLAALTPPQRQAVTASAHEMADSLVALVAANPSIRRWSILLWWGHAFELARLLQVRTDVRYRSVTDFLPDPDVGPRPRMDARHIAWILSGVLDEWYGMWAPQVFPSERIAGLVRELQALQPADPTTRFLLARWMIQRRDYAPAESLLAQLARTPSNDQLSFPLNGKWSRPPWPSVARKAKLNLAFMYDLRGNRDSALTLYRELLSGSDSIDMEGRAAGYTYDDLRSVLESYIQSPYTGLPQEAFRHYRLAAAIPSCDPAKPR